MGSGPSREEFNAMQSDAEKRILSVVNVKMEEVDVKMEEVDKKHGM